MSNPTPPSSADMQNLLEELEDAAFKIRDAYSVGNTPRVIGDGVYMAGKFGDVLAYIRSLEERIEELTPKTFRSGLLP